MYFNSIHLKWRWLIVCAIWCLFIVADNSATHHSVSSSISTIYWMCSNVTMNVSMMYKPDYHDFFPFQVIRHGVSQHVETVLLLPYIAISLHDSLTQVKCATQHPKLKACSSRAGKETSPLWTTDAVVWVFLPIDIYILHVFPPSHAFHSYPVLVSEQRPSHLRFESACLYCHDHTHEMKTNEWVWQMV